MHPRTLRYLLPALILGAGATLAVANSTGPQLGRTGAPKLGTASAERTCSDAGCHSGHAVNDGNGKVELVGVPDRYTPGASYPITVRLSSTSTRFDGFRRWGFELTVARLSDGEGAGTFSSPSLTTVIGSRFFYHLRPYATQNFNTLKPGASSPVEWTVTWSAPDADQGDVGFYVAGNAANGNLSNSGDFIYTGSDTARSNPTPAAPASWGELKARY